MTKDKLIAIDVAHGRDYSCMRSNDCPELFIGIGIIIGIIIGFFIGILTVI